MRRVRPPRVVLAALLPAALFAGAVLLSGCWDRLEIEERSAVLGLGIDPAPERQEGVLLTAQLAIPGEIPLGPRGGGGSGGSGSGGGGGRPNPVWVLTVAGKNVDDALERLQRELENRLFFGHLRVIVLNQSIARQGMDRLLDPLRRNPQVRRLTWLFISKGAAVDTLKAAPPLELVPALYLSTQAENQVEMGRLPNIFLGRIWIVLSNQGEEVVVPFIDARDDRVIGGALAAFRGDRMVGVIDGANFDAYLQLRGVRKGHDLIWVPFRYKGMVDDVGVRVFSRQQRMRLTEAGGLPRVQIRLRLEGNIESHQSAIDFGRDEVLQAFQEEAQRVIERQLHSLIAWTKERRIDVFGFGEEVRGRLPAIWERVGADNRWAEFYPRLPIEVGVEFNVRRTGAENR